MTTPISGSGLASLQTNTSTDVAVAQVPHNTQASNSLEETVLSLANSLSGYTSRHMQQPTTHPRIFARMERLVDSISRLIDAIANYRSATKQEPTGTTEQGPIQERSAGLPDLGGATAPPPVETPVAQNPVEAPAPTPAPEVSPPIELTPEVEHEAVPTSPPGIELGSHLPATGGFLWKPISDKNGDLAVLLPKQYTGKIKQVRILNPEGTKAIAKGKYSGVGNGDREHFRFTKPGGGYPDGAIVLIEMENGAIRHFKIKDTSKRTER